MDIDGQRARGVVTAALKFERAYAACDEAAKIRNTSALMEGHCNWRDAQDELLEAVRQYKKDMEIE